MSGLLSQANQQPAATPADAAPQSVAPEQEPVGGDQVSPEEQQWYDGVQQAAADILFNDDKASQTVLSMLNAKQAGISCGNAAAEVLLQVDRGMDGEIPETVILPAAEEILEHVLDIAEAAKLLKRSPDVEEVAAQAMVARLAEEYGVDQQGFDQARAKVA